MYRFNELIVFIGKFVIELIIDKEIQSLDISLSVLNILTLFFYIIGSLVYLEFIELNFCNLNFYTKRNIKERSAKDNTFYNINDGEYSKYSNENDD